MNVIKQDTPRWHRIKQMYFGANDCACLLGHGFNTRSAVIQSKVNQRAIPIPSESVARVEKGKRYEPVVRRLCAKRRKFPLIETGLKFHPQYPFITASPDGYCEITDSLTEFKVRNRLSETIPYKYWIQMQVQMAVWSVPNCLYCENVVDEYKTEEELQEELKKHEGYGHGQTEDGYFWRLTDFREETVRFNPEFFDKAVEEFKAAWNDVKRQQAACNEERETPVPTKRAKKERKEPFVIRASMLSNYLRTDCILDWLNLYGPQSERDAYNSSQSFLSFLGKQKRLFRDVVQGYVTTHFRYLDGFTRDVSFGVQEEPYIAVTQTGLQKTRDAMQDRVPIIFNAVFQNETSEGAVEMLILGKCVKDVFGEELVSTTEDSYIPVFFQCGTLHLRSDGRHLLNQGGQKLLKARAFLACQAFDCTKALVVGRQATYKVKGTTHRTTSAFDKVGLIDFNDVDLEYEETVAKAIEWVNRVHLQKGRYEGLDLFNKRVLKQNPELYPNMKNTVDYPWHGFKQRLATEIKEITLGYRLGPKQRREAMEEHGIYRWSEMNLQPRNERCPPLEKATTHAVEIFMDFEFFTNNYDNFHSFPTAQDTSFVFLVGIFCVNHKTGTSQYVSYLLPKLIKSEERKLIERVLADIRSYSEENGEEEWRNVPIYHWGAAEATQLKRVFASKEPELNLVDLCSVLRKEKTNFPGQFGYGLKEVVKAMQEAGHLTKEAGWSDEGLSDGLSAMLEALKLYRANAVSKPLFKDLIHYNEVDCRVMYDVVRYFRQETWYKKTAATKV